MLTGGSYTLDHVRARTPRPSPCRAPGPARSGRARDMHAHVRVVASLPQTNSLHPLISPIECTYTHVHNAHPHGHPRATHARAHTDTLAMSPTRPEPRLTRQACARTRARRVSPWLIAHHRDRHGKLLRSPDPVVNKLLATPRSCCPRTSCAASRTRSPARRRAAACRRCRLLPRPP